MAGVPIWNADKTRVELRTGEYYTLDLLPTEADCRASPRWRTGLTYVSSTQTRLQLGDVQSFAGGHPDVSPGAEGGPYYGLHVEFYRTHAGSAARGQRMVGRPLHPHPGLVWHGQRGCCYVDRDGNDVWFNLPSPLTVVITGVAGHQQDRHLHHDHVDTNTRLAALESAMAGLALHLAPDAEDIPAALRSLTSFRKG